MTIRFVDGNDRKKRGRRRRVFAIRARIGDLAETRSPVGPDSSLREFVDVYFHNSNHKYVIIYQL